MVPAFVLGVFLLFTVAITWRPATVIGLAFCIFPFEQWAQANSRLFVGQNSSLINYGLGILILFALACAFLRGRNPIYPITPAAWTWLVMVIFAGVSCLWSLDRSTSIFLFKYHLPYVVVFVGLLPMVLQKPEDIRIGLMTTLVFGVIVLSLLILDTRIHAWGRTIEVEHGQALVNRVGGTQTRLAPLAVAATAGQIMLIAALMNFKGVERIWQVLRWGIIIMALALIFRSGSRGQLIASVMAMLMYVVVARDVKKIWGWIAGGASALAFLGYVLYSFSGQVTSGNRWDISKMSESFQSTRLEYCATLLSYWMESSPMNWLFGLGSSASYDSRILGFYCHVVIVEVLAELGVFGLCLFVMYLTFVTRALFRLYKMTRRSAIERGVTVALMALFTFQMIITFKEGSFLSHTYTLGLGLIICRHAALVATEQKLQRRKTMMNWYRQYYQQVGQAPDPVTTPV